MPQNICGRVTFVSLCLVCLYTSTCKLYILSIHLCVYFGYGYTGFSVLYAKLYIFFLHSLSIPLTSSVWSYFLFVFIVCMGHVRARARLYLTCLCVCGCYRHIMHVCSVCYLTTESTHSTDPKKKPTPLITVALTLFLFFFLFFK